MNDINDAVTQAALDRIQELGAAMRARPIPSFTAWKRLLHVGAMIKVTGLQPDYARLDSVRPITRLKSNAMATRYVRPDGEVVDECWIYWPTTACIFVDGNAIELSDPISGMRWVR